MHTTQPLIIWSSRFRTRRGIEWRGMRGCVCVSCVCTWWNQPQVSTFLLLGFISFAFFSRADCWLSALISACSLNTQFFPPMSEPCLENQLTVHLSFRYLLLPFYLPRSGTCPCFQLRIKEEVSAVIWGILPGIAEKSPKWGSATDLLGDLTSVPCHLWTLVFPSEKWVLGWASW